MSHPSGFPLSGRFLRTRLKNYAPDQRWWRDQLLSESPQAMLHEWNLGF
jgi:hypothetical protein